MNPTRLLPATTTLVFALLFTFAVPTATASTPTPPPPPDMRKLIQSVNATAGTVVIEDMHDKSTHTYTLDLASTITVSNNPGKITDIKAGMEVSDSTERDDHTLDSITVTEASPGPPSEKPKKKTPKPAPAASQ